MLANSKPLSLFKEGFRNRISIASLMRRLNMLLSVARTFVLLESTECPVSWQCSWTAELANIYNTILGPLRPLWSDITLLNIHISTVADEVRLVRTKYSTSTVFNFYCALSQEIFYYFFKIMFPEQENNIFDCICYHCFQIKKVYPDMNIKLPGKRRLGNNFDPGKWMP